MYAIGIQGEKLDTNLLKATLRIDLHISEVKKKLN